MSVVRLDVLCEWALVSFKALKSAQSLSLMVPSDMLWTFSLSPVWLSGTRRKRQTRKNAAAEKREKKKGSVRRHQPLLAARSVLTCIR
jgi:hypothetical protein